MRYSQEVKDFIAINVKGTTTKDLIKMVNDKFGTEFTSSKMKSYKKNHNLKSGTLVGLPKGHASSTFPQHIGEYIRANHKGVGPKKMAEMLNAKYGTEYKKSQLKSYYANHSLNSGLTGRYNKGHVPANKGKKGVWSPASEKTWFKKGQPALNQRPVGSERIDPDGYTLIKIEEPNVWKLKHKVMWEAVNGSAPEGYVVTFLDGNKQNMNLDNLALISMAESLELNRSNLRSENQEFTKTGILIARAKTTQRKREKEKRK